MVYKVHSFLLFIFKALLEAYWGLAELMEAEEQARNQGRRLQAWRLEAK